MRKILLAAVLLTGLIIVPAASAVNPLLMPTKAKGKAPSSAQESLVLPANLSPAEIDALLARMDDDQVRRLLIAELQKEAAAAAPAAQPEEFGGLRKFLNDFEDITLRLANNGYALVLSLSRLPADFGQALDRLSGFAGPGRLAVMLLVVTLIIGAGWVAEKLFFRGVSALRSRTATMPGMTGWQRFVGSMLKLIPALLGLLVFTFVPLMIFFLIVAKEDKSLRLLFVAVMLAVCLIRLAALILRTILSPRAAPLRLVPLADQAAVYLYRRLMQVVALCAVSWVLVVLFHFLELTPASQVWLAMAASTLVVALLAAMVWGNREALRQRRQAPGTMDSEERSWLRDQSAALWPILALAYLLLLWLLSMAHMILAGRLQFNGVFIMSLLIVPIYLILDRLAQWCVGSALARGAVAPSQAAADEDAALLAGDPATAAMGEAARAAASAGEAPPAAEVDRYLAIVRRVVRLAVFAAVALWFLDIWGFKVPVGEKAIGATFNILVTLLLAHIAWELISGAINRRLAQAAPEDADGKQDDEDEWGGAVAQDRSQTLLPMLRKFLGVVMVVMVTLIVLSSLGVDIGPLLAGAGVVGLAIGFGAQKLVRDILSGAFFLIDDAFRVGEYLEAGGLSGVVEQITLRTIKLRHHRGMLQIVPMGDLKSITNYMRGGIVVKFDLQLPYDTDIELVRKVIKKVGVAMLQDEEFSSDFIMPVKSQGVRSVGDSVMTFRVKFTARPGKHFVIRREAFRRITEALEHKGIKYAHRKVIVDLAPEAMAHMGAGAAPISQAAVDKAKIVQAGAAAALDTILADDQSQDPQAQKKKDK